MAGSVSCLQVKEENLPEDHSTLLHQHMNEELQGGIVRTMCIQLINLFIYSILLYLIYFIFYILAYRAGMLY